MLTNKQIMEAYEGCAMCGYSEIGEGNGLFLQTLESIKKEHWYADDADKFEGYDNHDIFLLTDTGDDPVYVSSVGDLLEELKGCWVEEGAEDYFVVIPRFASKYLIAIRYTDGRVNRMMVTGEAELANARKKLLWQGFTEREDKKIDAPTLEALIAACNSLSGWKM